MIRDKIDLAIFFKFMVSHKNDKTLAVHTHIEKQWRYLSSYTVRSKNELKSE